MTLDLESRRAVRQLTRADFAAYPVWEWALNEQDAGRQEASLLRPTSLDLIPAGGAGLFVVGASTTLSDGTVLPACAQVQVRGKQARGGQLQVMPMFILMPDRHLDFAGQATDIVLNHYTKVNGTRPVSWQLAVPMAGQAVPASGSLRPTLLRRVFGAVRRLGMPSKLPGSPSSHLL